MCWKISRWIMFDNSWCDAWAMVIGEETWNCVMSKYCFEFMNTCAIRNLFLKGADSQCQLSCKGIWTSIATLLSDLNIAVKYIVVTINISTNPQIPSPFPIINFQKYHLHSLHIFFRLPQLSNPSIKSRCSTFGGRFTGLQCPAYSIWCSAG